MPKKKKQRAEKQESNTMTNEITVVLSAPAKSGYRAGFETVAACRAKAAELLSGLREIDGEIVELTITPDTMIETDSPDGGTTYCYATQADADADQDGAYAVQYSEVA
jgi:hypothetical protein